MGGTTYVFGKLYAMVSVGGTALKFVGSRKSSVSFIGEPLNSTLALLSKIGLDTTHTVFSTKRAKASLGAPVFLNSNGTQPIIYSLGLSPTNMQLKVFASICWPREGNVYV